MRGYCRPGQWPSLTSESLWQMPQAWTLTRTQPAAGWGISRSTISNDPPGWSIWSARIFRITRFWFLEKPALNLAHFNLMATGRMKNEVFHPLQSQGDHWGKRPANVERRIVKVDTGRWVEGQGGVTAIT